MPIHRLKHTFTAGELSPLLDSRLDFERFKNGCKTMKNMACATQGPAVRRSGFKFVYDLSRLDLHPTTPRVRTIPFIFNESQAYVMIFYISNDEHSSGTWKRKVVFATTVYEGGEEIDGLVTFSDPPIDECPPGEDIDVTAGQVVTLDLPEGWSTADFDWAQSGDEMWIAQPGLQPHSIIRYSHTCWTVNALTFADQPAEWSAANGWPERVTFHQQRVVFGANKTRRQTIWMSKAGDFLDFSVGATLADDDAITFTLDSGTQNKIIWMSSSNKLNVGTIGNEWTVEGSTQAAITPLNVLTKRHTNNGGESNKPLVIGSATMFVERHGRVVNEFVYDYTLDSYKNIDLSILAPHMTTKYSIVDWAYQQTPDSIIWCVREDGTMIALTYQREHKVVGWHRHDTQGNFLTVTAIPGKTREDDIWSVVSRRVSGVTKIYLEKLENWFTADEAEYGRFVDSHLVYNGAPTNTLTGLNHLEEHSVDILTDGAVHPPVVVQGGKITLNNTYSHVVVGLHFESEVRPYLTDIPTQSGSSYGRTQRATHLDISFYKSLGVLIGREDAEDGESIEEAPFRVPGDLMGQQVPLYTGIYHWSFAEGFDRTVEYFIRQTQPLPLTVRGIVDVVEVQE